MIVPLVKRTIKLTRNFGFQLQLESQNHQHVLVGITKSPANIDLNISMAELPVQGGGTLKIKKKILVTELAAEGGG